MCIEFTKSKNYRERNIFYGPYSIRFRRCTKCKNIKLENRDNFKCSRTVNIFQPRCKACFSQESKESVIQNKEKLIIESTIDNVKLYDLSKKYCYVDNNGILYRKCGFCKKIKLENIDNFRLFNKKSNKGISKTVFHHWCYDCINKKVKLYRHKCQDKIKQAHSTPEFKQKRQLKKKERLMRDPVYRMRERVSNAVTHALKRTNHRKNGISVFTKLPYTPLQLKQHLESQFDENMNWDNYAIYWELDHIVPQSDLPYISMDEDNFQICWGLTNLRPLEKTQNHYDGVNRVRHKK